MKLFTKSKKRLMRFASVTAAVGAVMTLGWAVASHTNLLNGVFGHDNAYADTSCIHKIDGINVNDANSNATVQLDAGCGTHKLQMKSYYAQSSTGLPHPGQVKADDGPVFTVSPSDGAVKLGVETPGQDKNCFYQVDVVDLAGSNTVLWSDTGGHKDCTPDLTCKNLTNSLVSTDPNNGYQTYALTTTAKPVNVTIQHYDYAFGDGTGQSDPTSNSTSTVNHAFAPGQTYTVTSSVTALDGNGNVKTDQGPACTTTVSVPPFTPPVESLTCNQLTATPGSVDQNGNTNYVLTAKATPMNVTITNYVFDFGDGQTATVPSSSNQASTQHLYAPNDYTATVTVNGVDAAGKAFSDTNVNCQTPISVKPPVQHKLTCDSLTATPGHIDSKTGNQDYTLTAKATPTNVTITDYVFNTGDNNKIDTVKTNAKTANDKHNYAPGEYDASVTVNGSNNQSVTSDNCMVHISVKPLECKPGVPQGSPECSTLTCVALSVVPGTLNSDGSQGFTLNASASQVDATITGYVFHFGDGAADQTVQSAATTASTTHTYAASTTGYDVMVTVTGKDAAGNDIQNTNANCAKHITPSFQTPGVIITKVVNGKKSIVTSVGTQFTYTLKVTNNGQQDLTNVVVTDTPEAGVTLVSADKGTVDTSANTWTDTILSLKVNESQSFNITAVVPTYLAGSINNTACVNAPEVNPDNPDQMDSCDSATVTVTPPTTPPPTVTPPQVLGVTTLVNTGAGNMIGLFAIVAVAGTLAHRFFLSRKLSN